MRSSLALHKEAVQAVAVRAARRAGELIRGNFRLLPCSAVSRKAENDFVTRIDREAEQLIVAEIFAAFPTHSILAEESPIRSGRDRFVWVIDPLDGTTNYIRGLPICSVSIALTDGTQPIFGLVFDPFLDELFSAWSGDGAFLNGTPIRISQQDRLHGAFGATGFPFKSPPNRAGYLRVFGELVPIVGDMRRCGSAAIDLAYTACGRYDFFWEAHLLPWDFLAGELIVREAGGQTGNFEGMPLTTRTDTVLAAPPELFKQLRAIISAKF